MSIPHRGYFRMGLEVTMPWPSKETSVTFRGRELMLCPETDTLSPSVLVKTGIGFGHGEARRLVQEFLSRHVWANRGGAAETFSTGGTHPIQTGKKRGRVISDAPIEYIPDPGDKRAQLALALYREASSVNLLPFQFLGYYKIVNILFDRGRDQANWINSQLNILTDRDARERIAELQRTEPDVGHYLYVSGRCAVAHAFASPVVNPDEPTDTERLGRDLPLMRALAELVIEKELGVKSKRTVWEEHLYELEGFRELLGPDVVGRLKGGLFVDQSSLAIPARLSLRLRSKLQLKTFDSMEIQLMSSRNGILIIRCVSADGRVSLPVHLDFVNERLRCNAMTDTHAIDDGSRDAAKAMLDVHDFFVAWMTNGVVEVHDPGSGRRLGRSKPVLEELTNLMPDWKFLDAQRATLAARVASI